MEDLCLSLFSKNLKYFQNNYAEVYTKVINFTQAISNNELKQRYELRYENNKFVLYNLQNQSLCNNYTTDIQTITTISTEVFDNNFLNQQSFTPENLSAISNLKQLIKPTKFNFYKKHDTKVSKFIFVGVGLGESFNTIEKKLNPNSYLFIEPDIEVFYLSMFTIDYENFASNNQKLFSILDTPELISSKLEYLYKLNFTNNHSFKYIQNNPTYNFIFNNISTSLLNNNPLKYTYKAMLNDFKRKAINDKEYKHIDTNNNSFKDKPVLILSSGPSISKNIKEIKKYKNKFIIVAFAQTLKLLEKYNLKPDIITIIDSSVKMEEYFKLENKSFLKKCKLFANNTIYPKIFSYFKRKNIYLFDKKDDNIFGITVGEATYHLMLKLNTTNIYLLGVDLAFDKNKNAYEKSHIFNNKKESVQNIDYSSKEKTDSLKSLIKVKGNLRDKVYTNIFFSQLIENYNYISNHFKKPNVNIYNISDGAYLDNTIVFKKLKKLKKLKKIDKSFKINTKKITTQKELIKLEISNIDTLLKNDLFSKEVNTKYQFLSSLNNIVQSTLTIEESNIYSIHRQHICFNYFDISLNFLNYIIYSNSEFNYSLVYKIFINQIKDILEEYKKLCI